MALIKNKTQTAAPEFEGNPEDAQKTTAETPPTVNERVAASTAVAARPTTAVAQTSRAIVSPLKALENACTVDFNTLDQIKATQGQFKYKESERSLGDTITVELLSYQKNFLVSPGDDDEESAKLVRYSDDGITCKTGENCNEYLAGLIAAGYDGAKKSERVVIVGALVDAGKAADCAGSLFQMDLAPSSKVQFDRYQIQLGFDTAKGKVTAEGASVVKLTAVAVAKNKKDWTVVNFARA